MDLFTDDRFNGAQYAGKPSYAWYSKFRHPFGNARPRANFKPIYFEIRPIMEEDEDYYHTRFGYKFRMIPLKIMKVGKKGDIKVVKPTPNEIKKRTQYVPILPVALYASHEESMIAYNTEVIEQVREWQANLEKMLSNSIDLTKATKIKFTI